MGEEYLENYLNGNVDTRSDTTFKGYNERKVPYNAGQMTGTNPFTDVLGAIEYYSNISRGNPYIVTGTAPTPTRAIGYLNWVNNPAEKAAALDFLKSAKGMKSTIDLRLPSKVVEGYKYPEWAIRKYNLGNSKVLNRRSANLTQSERYYDRLNYSKKIRNSEKNDLAYGTGKASHVNSGQRRVKNEQLRQVKDNIIKYPRYEQRALDKLKLNLAKKGYTIEQIEKDSKIKEFYARLFNTYGSFKSGGKLLKKGNKIHIKKKNRGKFTSYCGGTVTNECIRKAKASGNSTLIKRATFAQNSRGWAKKHQFGGTIENFIKNNNNLFNMIYGKTTI